MFWDLIRTLLAAGLLGVIPGFFWARCLTSTGSDGVVTGAFSIGLSLASVPALALAQARLLGTGVSPVMFVVSASAVFFSGLVVYRRLGPSKWTEGTTGTELPRAPALRGAVLAPLVAGFALAFGSAAGFFPGSLRPLALTTAVFIGLAGVAHLFFRVPREARPEPEEVAPETHKEHGGLEKWTILAVVFGLALARGYLGPMLHDWPFIRGVDQYSHAVMANRIASVGEIQPYLIYPPGFHTVTAGISELSGLDPLRVFPVLAPSYLFLAALALYALAAQLWGWRAGAIAALLSTVLAGGPYLYFEDAMYPNLITAQVLLVLALAALVRVYTSPPMRPALAFAVIGGSVFLFHQVASLYLAAILALVGVTILPYLLLRDRRRGVTLLFSMVLLGALAVVYVWQTYDLPRILSGLPGGASSATGTAVEMAVGTQAPYSPGELLWFVVSPPVAWLGALGALLMLGEMTFGDSRRRMVFITLLLWGGVLVAGASTSMSGFPQRFGRDLSTPFSVLAAFAVFALIRSVPTHRRIGATFAASLVALLVFSMLTVRASQTLQYAAAPSWRLTMSPGIAAAGDWLREHNEAGSGGNIMVSPQSNQVPSRMMLAMGHYSALQSYTAQNIMYHRDLPPGGVKPLEDQLFVMNRPASPEAREMVRNYDVRYIVLFKRMPDRPVVPYFRLFEARGDLYRPVFENDDVLIVAPRER